MLACHCPLVAVVLAVCACTALSQEISWNYAETPTDNRPRFREDAFLFRLSLNRLALVGGLTGAVLVRGGGRREVHLTLVLEQEQAAA